MIRAISLTGTFSVTCLLSLGCIVGITIASGIEAEPLAGFAFSLLPSALLINVASVMASVGGNLRELAIAKALWIALGVLALSLTIYCSEQAIATATSDSDVFLFWVMAMLSFPLGIPFAIAAAIAIPHGGYAQLVGIWASAGVVGYLQWFVFVPRCKRHWNRSRKNVQQ